MNFQSILIEILLIWSQFLYFFDIFHKSPCNNVKSMATVYMFPKCVNIYLPVMLRYVWYVAWCFSYLIACFDNDCIFYTFYHLLLLLISFSTKTCAYLPLTHWGRVTHICVSNLTTIGSCNGLSPEQRQAIIWTNAGILLIVPLGTNISEIVN